MNKITLRCMVRNQADKDTQMQLIGFCLEHGLSFRADKYIMGTELYDKPISFTIEGSGNAFGMILSWLKLQQVAKANYTRVTI